MKTREEINNLIEAFRTVTKEINNAINAEDERDRISIAMLMIPLMPAIDEFLAALKKETEKENSSSENSVDNFMFQIKSNGPIS